jgi:hypothetical protein
VGLVYVATVLAHGPGSSDDDDDEQDERAPFAIVELATLDREPDRLWR